MTQHDEIRNRLTVAGRSETEIAEVIEQFDRDGFYKFDGGDWIGVPPSVESFVLHTTGDHAGTDDGGPEAT